MYIALFKRKLQRRNEVRDARTWKVGDSASPAVLIRTRRLISRCPVFRIWRERNQELWQGLRLESVASEASEWGYGHNVDSILSRSFGRKSQVRGHPARLGIRRHRNLLQSYACRCAQLHRGGKKSCCNVV